MKRKNGSKHWHKKREMLNLLCYHEEGESQHTVLEDLVENCATNYAGLLNDLRATVGDEILGVIHECSRDCDWQEQEQTSSTMDDSPEEENGEGGTKSYLT